LYLQIKSYGIDFIYWLDSCTHLIGYIMMFASVLIQLLI